MGERVARLTEGQYVIWSNTVDAPVSAVMDRRRMAATLMQRGLSKQEVAELLDVVDSHGTSEPGLSVEELVADNRAGAGERN